MPNPPLRKPKASPRPPSSRRPRTPHNPQAPHVFEPVDPAWILKALALMLGLALLFGYTTVCVVFSRSQWQIVLHPSRSVATTPASLGLAFTEVHFAPDASGQPQLDGWWIPTDSPSPSSPAATAILLHGGSGSISNALPQARTLHVAHLNVLLFDYRGFGRSAGHHPTEALMQADADSALTYLTATRGVPPASLVIFGDGLGASLAVRLCAQHPQIPALILESPDGDLTPRVRADTRSHLIPAGLLFRENFPLAAPLRTLPTPKLLISFTTGAAPPTLQQAANPKLLVETQPADQPAIQAAISRFLSSYVRP